MMRICGVLVKAVFVLSMVLILGACQTPSAFEKKTDESRGLIFGYVQCEGSSRLFKSIKFKGLSTEGKYFEFSMRPNREGMFYFVDLPEGKYQVETIVYGSDETKYMFNTTDIAKNGFFLGGGSLLYLGRIILTIETGASGKRDTFSIDVKKEPPMLEALNALVVLAKDSPWEAGINMAIQSKSKQN